MKAISIYQPWATWIVRGYKTIETRKHNRFRGLVGQTIAVHAGKTYSYIRYMKFHNVDAIVMYDHRDMHEYGAIIGTAKVLEARLLNECDSAGTIISDCAGLFGLILSDPVEFQTPIPYKGQQGIFNVPDELINSAVKIL